MSRCATISDVSESLINRVFYAARDGMAVTLYALLSEKKADTIQYILEQQVLDDDQRCTPLIIAAKNGHDKVVSLLLSRFKPSVEQEGMVKFDNFMIEGASPLWCAAGAGHLNVVKLLVQAGADVNHPTKSSSTPLRAACFDGRLDIVNYLIEHNADIHRTNNYNNSCLMIACYRGHSEVVSFLLERGADPNIRTNCKATALHFSCEYGHTQIVEKLFDYGAMVYKNGHGMSPLMSAAERTRSGMVSYLLRRPEFSRQEKIDSLELLGASFANDRDNYNLELAYSYLREAMLERFSDPNDVILKPTCPRIPAYENHVECMTLEELDAIQDNANALHMEGLVIRERILGRRCPEVTHAIVFQGAVFADNARFDRCISLWLHALDLRQDSGLSVSKDLLRFAQVFSQMIYVGISVEFSAIYKVLKACIDELRRPLVTVDEHHESQCNPAEELENNIESTMYILVIVSKVSQNFSESDTFEIQRLVYHLVSVDPRTRDRESLLHLAVNADTHVDDFHTNHVCKFPCADTAKLLIRCGADVDAVDANKNTPLHVIVSYQRYISDFTTLYSIINSLIDAGAHMDSVNNFGYTPLEYAVTGVADIMLRNLNQIRLKCLAAKAISCYQLPYKGLVPLDLEKFIALHGPERVS